LRTGAIVLNPYENDASLVVSGHVVGESADSFPNPFEVGCFPLPFGAVGLEGSYQVVEF